MFGLSFWAICVTKVKEDSLAQAFTNVDLKTDRQSKCEKFQM